MLLLSLVKIQYSKITNVSIKYMVLFFSFLCFALKEFDSTGDRPIFTKLFVSVYIGINFRVAGRPSIDL
jgi:hypothetical protein